jgi:hypothetical protein
MLFILFGICGMFAVMVSAFDTRFLESKLRRRDEGVYLNSVVEDHLVNEYQ